MSRNVYCVSKQGYSRGPFIYFHIFHKLLLNLDPFFFMRRTCNHVNLFLSFCKLHLCGNPWSLDSPGGFLSIVLPWDYFEVFPLVHPPIFCGQPLYCDFVNAVRLPLPLIVTLPKLWNWCLLAVLQTSS